MNSNITNENSTQSDEISKENNITLNNLSLRKEFQNTEITPQDESSTLRAQVAVGLSSNAAHNLITINLSNTNDQNSSSRMSPKLHTTNNIRYNLDLENSITLSPWINIAHFRIDARTFFAGGFCTLRQLNPNLGIFFVQDSSSSQPLYSLLTAARELPGLQLPLNIEDLNNGNELNTSRKKMKYTHEENMEMPNSANPQDVNASHRMTNTVSAQDENEINRRNLPKRKTCGKRHCRRLHPSHSNNNNNIAPDQSERQLKCRLNASTSGNLSGTLSQENVRTITDSSEEGNETSYCKKSKRRRRAARHDIIQEENRIEEVDINDLNPSISYEKTLHILRFLLTGSTSSRQVKNIAAEQHGFLMLIEYHFYRNPYNSPNQFATHGQRSPTRTRRRRPRILPEEPITTETRQDGYDGKLQIFRSQVKSTQIRIPKNFEIRIRRNFIFEDSFSKISKIDEVEKLKAKLWIVFEEEPGLDYGGVKREWFCLLSREIFNPDYGFFKCNTTQNNFLEINPDSASYHKNHLEYFRFIGRIVGMSLYHGSLIDASFSPIFYSTLLNKRISLEDIRKVDPEYYKNLSWVCDNDPSDLDLDFSVMDNVSGKIVNVDLIPSGSNVSLTNENKDFYIEHIINWKFIRRVKNQLEALHKGFHDIIPKEAIAIFTENELEKLICGVQEIDVKDWKKYTTYSEGYFSKHKTIKFFWELVKSFDNDMRAKLLQFVTGSSKVPMNGFKNLYGSNGPLLFSIQKFGSVDSLPRSHTCFNRLDLPPYECYLTLKEKLIFAIENCAGFGGVD